MTNQLCLQQQWNRLYKKTLQQIADYQSTSLDETIWIEWGFSITVKAWFSIQDKTTGYQFADQQEEIVFYKYLKPKFISLIDFFSLLYKSALFQPEDTAVKNKDYWERELDTCKNFLVKHQSFCRYYEQGNTTMDHVYFLQLNNQQPLLLGINENHWHTITSYSHLLARVISIKKYQSYIKGKMVNDQS